MCSCGVMNHSCIRPFPFIVSPVAPFPFVFSLAVSFRYWFLLFYRCSASAFLSFRHYGLVAPKIVELCLRGLRPSLIGGSVTGLCLTNGSIYYANIYSVILCLVMLLYHRRVVVFRPFLRCFPTVSSLRCRPLVLASCSFLLLFVRVSYIRFRVRL